MLFKSIPKELKEAQSLLERERIWNKFGFATQTKLVNFCRWEPWSWHIAKVFLNPGFTLLQPFRVWFKNYSNKTMYAFGIIHMSENSFSLFSLLLKLPLIFPPALAVNIQREDVDRTSIGFKKPHYHLLTICTDLKESKF